MGETKTNLQSYAMRCGTFMGFYWIFKFCLFPLGFMATILELLFLLLTLGVPVLGYLYTRRFRDRYCEGSIPFLRAWTFCFLVYMFATILTAVAHYVYFAYIDGGFLFQTYGEMLQQMGDMEGMQQYVKAVNTMLEEIKLLSPIELTMQLISQNLFYGAILAVPTALLVMRKKRDNLMDK